MQLDPMTPDERKKVHNALSTWKNIKTESVGDGKSRAIVVKWTGGDTPVRPGKRERAARKAEQEAETTVQENLETTPEEKTSEE